MKLADYERLFDQMLPGLRMVSLFGGGEPLAHPDVEGILRAIKARGWTGAMITNGSHLREKIARIMIETGWENLRISAHAGDAATYRVIHGRNNFERVRENLLRWDRLRKENPSPRPSELAMHHVIQRENLGGIDAMFDFAQETGVDALSFLPIIPYKDGQELTRGELEFARAALASAARASKIPVWLDPLLRSADAPAPMPAPETVATPVPEVLPVAGTTLSPAPEVASAPASAPAPAPFRPAKRCSVGYDYAVVSAFGDVTPCCHSDEVLGNVRERSFGEVWNGALYREFRTRLMRGDFAPYCASNRCSIEEVLHD